MAKWIQAAHLKRGAFTAKAKAAGKGVQELAREKAHAPGRTGKQARLALTFAAMGKARHDANRPRPMRDLTRV